VFGCEFIVTDADPATRRCTRELSFGIMFCSRGGKACMHDCKLLNKLGCRHRQTLIDSVKSNRSSLTIRKEMILLRSVVDYSACGGSFTVVV
jgi:hypothetical protein